jgi:lipopolysaccharide/colanic/teichoic acid biosynthesis glycosyltransferase
MKDIFDGNGNPLPNKDRVTNIGRLLRKTSIDEIPQLFNIIKGDMSFIGPRPLFEQYLPFYTDQEKLRHSVRPGISGLAQISGRNLLEWEQRLVLDVEYATNISFMLDFNIFIKTIKKVFKSEGISVIPQMKPLHIVRQQQTTKN